MSLGDRESRAAAAGTPDSAVGSGKDPSALGAEPSSSRHLGFWIYSEEIIPSIPWEDGDKVVSSTWEGTHTHLVNTRPCQLCHRHVGTRARGSPTSTLPPAILWGHRVMVPI